MVLVPSCSYLDSCGDKFSVWFYLVLVLGFMYYPIYKEVMHGLAHGSVSIVSEGQKYILHSFCPTVVPPDQEYI